MLPQTMTALDRARACADFGDILFVTDRPGLVPCDRGIRVAEVASLRSRNDYSHVVQTGLADIVQSPFVLLIQWDGYPVRPENWTDAFFDYDYIGAPWPQFPEPMSVGNGGFSLRSKALLDACRDPRFRVSHPEDVGICHLNRSLLETEHGLRIAPRELAKLFSYERMGSPVRAFGFHGLFNMPAELGMEDFLLFFETLELEQVGVRELSDVREVLLRAREPAPRAAASRILHMLVRRRWHDPALWRYAWRKLKSKEAEIPSD